MIRHIAIVGAGFAGLSTAKLFKAFGFQVTVFEKEPDVGGVWAASRRYPGLTTQNPRSTYALSDYPMPDHYPEWPSGEQVQAYLAGYVRHFGLDELLRLGTVVQQARFDEARQQWTLTTRRGSDAPQTQLFDYLVVCNGIFSAPSVPDYPGAEAFRAAGGRLCHTSEFNRLEDARGRHVLVVGYGKSSCDVACATVGVSASTTVLARHLIWKIPKKFMDVLNFKFLLLTRMGEALFPYIERRGVERFLHGVGRPLRNAMMASVQAVVTRQLQLRRLGLHPGKPLETIARSTVSLVTDGFYAHVAQGRLQVAKGVSIRQLRAGEAELSDGRVLPADVVVCGTGWRQEVPFLPPEVMRRVTDAEGNFRLYRALLPVDMPRLAFNGYNSSFFSQLNCEVGAMWLVDHLKGGLQLPPREVQDAHVTRRLAWMAERTDGKHSKGTNIIPFSVHNIDELLADMRLPLGRLTRVRQWLEPINPADYRVVAQALARRYDAPQPQPRPSFAGTP